MITNADITIYNRKYNKKTRLDEWHRTVLSGVNFYVDYKSNIGEKGLNGSRVYKIRIPGDVRGTENYVDEEEFFNLTDVENHWTLQDGDIIVKGICDLEMCKPSDLTQLHKTFCKITSWSDNRRGALPHWRIGGV